jgi:hypothetical protein
MINGIDSSTSTSQTQMYKQRENYKMTDEQKQSITDLLSQYDDVSTLSDDEKQTLMDKIKDMGIKPGDDLKNIMDSAGFEPPKPPEGGMKDANSSSSTDSTKELPSFLTDFISKYQSGQVSDDDMSTLFSQLKANNLGSVGNLYDTSI